MDPIPPNAWRCTDPVRPPPTRYNPALDADIVLDPGYCLRCGAPIDMHPLYICCGCPHMVRKHGVNTDGCGHIGAAGWCECPLTFDRSDAEFVKWG